MITSNGETSQSISKSDLVIRKERLSVDHVDVSRRPPLSGIQGDHEKM